MTRKNPPLTRKQKDEILAIITIGGSRQTAARYAGCTPGQIQSCARSDTEFATQLRHAQEQAEITSLRHLSEAAKQERYWKAAAWILERKNPEEFRLRPPNVLTPAQLRGVVVKLAEMITSEVKSPTSRKRILAKIEELLKDF